MSLLPQYKSDTKFNEEESLPLWVNHDNEDDHDHKDDEESLPGYPPRHSDLYISGASGSGTKSHTITYILCKSWGREDEVLGVLGKSKEETIAITQRIFKELTSIPAERIELLVPFEQDNESGGKNTKWIKISDDAWSIRFDNSDDPPKSLKIKMIPTPEEEAESEFISII
ncbi:uncharacterized protein L201_005737 [Kwoniella dendrophila CBS 6074]|uniref:Uncharacterized protein n=1 Tax=Kwoniella dendrophila CBS 6074 TaxID=1295534 RepID=A0AAX4K205_9TREE